MRLIPTSFTQRTVDPNNPTGGMTIDALRARQLALQKAAPEAPAKIASPWQGAAYMASVFANSQQQKQAAAEEAAGRQKLAQAMAGINFDTGATPDQIATISGLDEDLGSRMVADAISARRQAATRLAENSEWERRNSITHKQDVDAAAALAAKPDAPTAKILDDFKRGAYGDPASPEAQALRDADIRKATNIQRPGTKASDLKMIYSQQDDLASYENTLKNLDRAAELNPQVPVGRIAQTQATLKGNLPEGTPEWITGSQEAADASKEFWQIMDEQAIAQMSAQLKGATTDTELAQFKQILSDPSSSPKVRQGVIDRMKSLVQRQRDMAKARLDDMQGAEDMGAPAAAAPTTPAAPPAAAPAAPAAPAAAAPDLSTIPEGAVLDLRNDPTPEAQAEFEEFFKLPPGTAKKIIGGQ